MQRVYKDTLIIKYSAFTVPTQMYAVSFKATDCASLEDLTIQENMNVKLIEEVKVKSDGDNEIEKEISTFIPTIKKETIRLDNGAEGHFIYSPTFEGKRPVVVIIHGGPFGCAP